MVELLGHVGMALLFATPAWFLWDRRPSVTFAGFTLVTAMLPDVDLWLEELFASPLLQHHGLTHTIPFVLIVGVLFGVVAAYACTPLLNAHRLIQSDSITPGTTFVFTTGAFWAGGLSHVFADLLSAAPDAAIAPLWPLSDETLVIDVIAYDSTAWNVVFLSVALVLHVVLYRSERYPYRTRYGLDGN